MEREDPPTFEDRDGDTWPATGPVERVEPDATNLLRFKLGTVLGRGGMGEVLSARDDEIGRFVAIKRLKNDTPSEAQITRFMREVRIQARLEHPAIVPVYELAHDDAGRPFFVMKQLAGITLASVLRKLATGHPDTVKKFSRQRLLRAFADVCLAAEFAHTRGVVHRDLKPSNIVLGEFGEVYVLDWGIAHVMAESARAKDFADVQTVDEHIIVDGMILGSPGYMSPEQIRVERDLDGRADVYALGCILFEILALEPLHESGLAGVALALTGVDARPSQRTRTEIPPELDAICVRATASDRAERYASARELHEAIQQFLDGDRDLELRKQLAASELAAARGALAQGGSTAYAAAVRAATRALALDPASQEPAELVGRLMLEPPKQVPLEVTQILERLDDDALWNARKLIVLAAIAYLAFVPLLFVIGFREPGFLVLACVLPAVMWALAATAKRENVVLVAYTGLIGNSLMTMLYAWAASPFLVAPSLGVITAMSLATHPRVARPWVLVGVISAGVLVPVLLEYIGLLPRSTFFQGSTVTLQLSAVRGLEQTTTTITFVVYVVALFTMAVVLTRSLTGDRRAAQRMVETQAWQLRQLVPLHR